MSELSFKTPKDNAIRNPERKCRFFGEGKNTYECTALTQCFCAIEEKSCPFFKRREAGDTHIGDAPKPKPIGSAGRPGALNVPSERLMKKIMKEHEMGASFESLAKANGLTRKQLDKGRRYYGFPMDSAKRHTDIPEDKIQHIIAERKAGRSWRSLEVSTGFSIAVMQARLKERGINL